jgi:hypothetical protein
LEITESNTLGDLEDKKKMCFHYTVDLQATVAESPLPLSILFSSPGLAIWRLFSGSVVSTFDADSVLSTADVGEDTCIGDAERAADVREDTCIGDAERVYIVGDGDRDTGGGAGTCWRPGSSSRVANLACIRGSFDISRLTAATRESGDKSCEDKEVESIKTYL